MTAVARTHALLRPDDLDGGNLALARLAARLCAPVSRHLAAIAGGEVPITASSEDTVFGKWQKPSSSTLGYRLGSACAVLIAVDDKLSATLVEQQFGGGTVAVTRPLSGQCRASASLARDIGGAVAHAIGQAWPGGMVPEIVATPDTAQFARADDRVATITLATPSGRIAIAFATGSIARLVDTARPPRIADWGPQLRGSVMAARLPVRAVFAHPQFPAATVLHLAVGDVLPISKPAFVPLYAGAHRVATGALTEANGRTAVQIHIMEFPGND